MKMSSFHFTNTSFYFFMMQLTAVFLFCTIRYLIFFKNIGGICVNPNLKFMSKFHSIQ